MATFVNSLHKKLLQLNPNKTDFAMAILSSYCRKWTRPALVCCLIRLKIVPMVLFYFLSSFCAIIYPNNFLNAQPFAMSDTYFFFCKDVLIRSLILLVCGYRACKYSCCKTPNTNDNIWCDWLSFVTILTCNWQFERLSCSVLEAMFIAVYNLSNIFCFRNE